MSQNGSFDPTKYTKSKWMKGSDLQMGRAVLVTIGKAWEHFFEQQGETKVALKFDEMDQDLACNKTQVMTLIELFGPDPRAWVGQRISLLAVPSNYQGKPTILISEAQVAPPTAAGRATPVKAPGYSREDAQRDMARRQQQPNDAPPDWASAPPEQEDVLF